MQPPTVIPRLTLQLVDVTFYMLVLVLMFLLSTDLVFKSIFFEIFFQEYYQSVKQLHFVRPNLGPNCLEKLSSDDTIRQRAVKVQLIAKFCTWTIVLIKQQEEIGEKQPFCIIEVGFGGGGGVKLPYARSSLSSQKLIQSKIDAFV